jgi:hypothetical protein
VRRNTGGGTIAGVGLLSDSDEFLVACGPETHPNPGQRLAALAARQHGVVHRRQLAAIGVDGSRVKRWIAAGRLHRLHRGVYAVGHGLVAFEGRCLAGALACGPQVWVGARSSAALWGLAPRPGAGVDLTTTRTGVHSPPGLTVRRSRRLSPDEIGRVGVIPVTSVSRTLADLAALVSRRHLERAMEQADRMQLLDVSSLLASSRDRPGAVAVKAVLGAWSPAPTRSDLEDRLLAVVEGSALPRPAVNLLVAGMECDQVWEAARLVVEADSRTFHATHAAFERDRRKDARLARAGYRVLRFTWTQVTQEPGVVIATIAAALPRSG